MAEHEISVSICIPWREKDPKLFPLIKNIEKLDYPKKLLEVIIIVNNSRLKPIKSSIPLHIIHTKELVGYAKAANIATKKAKGSQILLINPDVLLEKKMLSEMITFQKKNNSQNIVGPKVFSLINPKKISMVDVPGWKFKPSLGKVSQITEDEIKSLNKPIQVDWISGCCMLYAKKIWKQIHGFDEQLFTYWEDADFCLRAKRLGFKTLLVPAAHLWHAGSYGIGKNTPQKIYYIVRNGLYVLSRNSNSIGKLLLHTKTLLVLGNKFLKLLLGIDREINKAYCKGIIAFYVSQKGKRRSL